MAKPSRRSISVLYTADLYIELVKTVIETVPVAELLRSRHGGGALGDTAIRPSVCPSQPRL